MQNLLNPKFPQCTAQEKRWSERGEVFKRLSAEDQRRLAMRVIERAGRRLRLSVLINRDYPPDLEHHRVRKTIWSVAFDDRERAIAWVIKAYGLGLAVHHTGTGVGSGLGHPCEGRT